ncbi:fatty acid desaturase [Breoghania sp. JC706]|uniref:fatty acid desaturase n=1 Tax=Breoghania sp. JC706 TaxID=3117732 RepID=UPI00300A99E8
MLIADTLYHRVDLAEVTAPPPGADIVRHYRKQFRGMSYKPLDIVLGPLAYVWTYLFIIAAILAFHHTDYLAVKIAAVLFVTGRFRSLQEIGHHAAHGSLGPARRFNEILTNLLYQFPAFMPEIRRRHQVHVVEHHHSVNMDDDPDRIEMEERGFAPGITPLRFWLGVFRPLTPVGILERLKECWGYLTADMWNVNLALRLLSVAVVVGLFVAFGYYWELLFLYVVPVLVTYPLAYWIAHIALHRWYAACEDGIPYHERELRLGRPTDFPGPIGALVRSNVFPYGDSYHLAHSLFPSARWNYLPAIDAVMKRDCPEYANHGSRGLFFGSGGRPSALDELRHRMVGNGGLRVAHAEAA